MPDYTEHEEATFESIGAGGLVQGVPPWQLAPDQWQDAVNVQFVRGGVERVKGWAALASAIPDVSVANDNLPVAGVGFLNPVLNYRSRVIVTDKRIYANVITPTGFAGAGTWVDILGANWTNVQIAPLLLFPQVGFERYRNVLYIVAGDNDMRSWDGTAVTVTTVAGLPRGHDLIFFGERGVMARVRAATSPETIRWSDANNLTSWPGANEAQLERLPGTMMRLKRTGQWALAYKEQGIERLLITPNDANPFASDIVDDGVGLAGDGALASYRNADYFVSEESIHKLQDLRLEDIGGPVRAGIFGGNLTVQVCGVFTDQDPDYDEVVFSTGADVYTYNPLWQTWSKRKFNAGLQFVATYHSTLKRHADSGTVGKLRSFFCFVGGKTIYELNRASDTYPTGENLESSCKGAWWDAGTKKMKRLFAYIPHFERASGTTMTVKLRIYKSTHDTRPATGNNVFTKTDFVLNGSRAYIDLQGVEGVWIEPEFINNSNTQPWRLTGHTAIFKTDRWH